MDNFLYLQGFYYSYYKTLVQAPSLWQGVRSVMNDNTTEFPERINAFQRFNIFPEVKIILVCFKHWLMIVGLRQ